MSLIAVSFASLMIREQTRSTDDEQSQGAYDAAIAGAEDAKRTLLECKSGTGASKAAACAAINAEQCNTVVAAGVAGSIGDDEVRIASNSGGGGGELNLAYTCVIIDPSTDDYLGILTQHDDSVMVPLKSASSFDRVRVSWFTEADSTTTAPVGAAVPGEPLYTRANWPADRPPVLRAQLMQYPSGNLGAAGLFNDSPYAHTLYLYPKTAGSASLSFLAWDNRRTTVSPLRAVPCQNVFNAVTGFSCQTTLLLPTSGPITNANREGFLRLSSIYNGAHFRVELLNGGAVVPFDDVQPRIDATGRANDIFRRVESRVEYLSDFPYPRATVDITNNFCKTLFVAALGADYSDGGCLPTGP